MDDFRYRLGQRLKSYRLHKNLSQEKLAELADCHPTYVGQLERGEKNPTVESVRKVANALDISLAELFAYLDGDLIGNSSEKSEDHTHSPKFLPMKCYEIILSKPLKEQEKLYEILVEIEKYKGEMI